MESMIETLRPNPSTKCIEGFFMPVLSLGGSLSCSPANQKDRPGTLFPSLNPAKKPNRYQTPPAFEFSRMLSERALYPFPGYIGPKNASQPPRIASQPFPPTPKRGPFISQGPKINALIAYFSIRFGGVSLDQEVFTHARSSFGTGFVASGRPLGSRLDAYSKRRSSASTDRAAVGTHQESAPLEPHPVLLGREYPTFEAVSC